MRPSPPHHTTPHHTTPLHTTPPPCSFFCVCLPNRGNLLHGCPLELMRKKKPPHPRKCDAKTVQQRITLLVNVWPIDGPMRSHFLPLVDAGSPQQKQSCTSAMPEMELVQYEEIAVKRPTLSKGNIEPDAIVEQAAICKAIVSPKFESIDAFLLVPKKQKQKRKDCH